MVLKSSFQSIFDAEPTVKTHASGRVNLIGEHTDYNGGFVLPTAIPQTTQVALTPRTDDLVRLSSLFDGEVKQCEYRLGDESLKKTWTDYLQGISWLLKKDGFPLKGFDAYIESSVPMGSGLSSSAAFEVSLTRALSKAFSLGMDDVAIARFSQRVENEFVGARVGIMDPMAASICEVGTALFLDARDLSFEKIVLPGELELIVINSGVSHSNVGGDYNTRRGECEAACKQLNVGLLRDLEFKDLPLLDPLPHHLKKRSRHVLTENQRVFDAVKAIKVSDLETLGKLFNESHVSMRDDYEISIPEIDMLVSIAQEHPQIYGARLTGGGFGGSIVAAAKKGTAADAADEISKTYQKRSMKKSVVLVP